MINIKNLNITIILTLLFIGCEKDTTSNVEPINDISGRSSWKIIQEEILDKVAQVVIQLEHLLGNQSELILTADVAYENLINREPHNQAAKDDGLELVGTEGLGSLYKVIYGKESMRQIKTIFMRITRSMVRLCH